MTRQSLLKKLRNTNHRLTREPKMGKVKSWLMDMQSDAHDMSVAEFKNKWGEQYMPLYYNEHNLDNPRSWVLCDEPCCRCNNPEEDSI